MVALFEMLVTKMEFRRANKTLYASTNFKLLNNEEAIVTKLLKKMLTCALWTRCKCLFVRIQQNMRRHHVETKKKTHNNCKKKKNARKKKSAHTHISTRGSHMPWWYHIWTKMCCILIAFGNCNYANLFLNAVQINCHILPTS